ncbi:kinase-like domain-containing protein [Spinellus fusiger]|nr:kinase-like domain-containing protein [Spinellus fusiger]
MECKYNELRFSEEVIAKPGLQKRPWLDIYVIQRYYEHGDLRDYMEKRDSPLGPFEVLQIALSLFAALADVHALDIGIVDLKLENILVDTTGSAWITDFGAKEIRLSDTRHGWTKSVAAPASDVFMAMVILCEIMTFEMSDEEFLAKVLIRHKKSNVTFCSDQIHPAYRGFLHILKAGLNNHHRHRPSAQDVFTYLEAMRRDTLKEFSKSLFSSSQSIQLNTKDIIPHSDIDSDLLSERMLCTDDENNRIPYTDDENDKTSGTDEESVSKVKTKPNIQHKHKKKRYTTDPDADYVDYQVLQNHPMTDSHLPQHHKMVSSLFQKTSLDKISETPLAFEYKGKEVEIHPCKEITSKYEANGYPTTEGEKSKPHQLNDTNLTTHCYSVEREISHSSHPTEHHYRRRKSGTPGTYDFLELTCSELSEEYTINDEDISE